MLVGEDASEEVGGTEEGAELPAVAGAAWREADELAVFPSDVLLTELLLQPVR